MFYFFDGVQITPVIVRDDRSSKINTEPNSIPPTIGPTAQLPAVRGPIN
jgi:hypothetical protein